MKLWLRSLAHLTECVILGFWIAMMVVVLPGGIYEISTGSPSDSFLFYLMIVGFPVVGAVLVMVPMACWKNKKCLRVARQTGLFFLVALVAIRFMQP
ncbi:hypothetical protein [Prosthecobacter sp.]|uniref:hypothetical protein n=1 Tax=Prosthecobacter sp. TaxID=1965333 RepID=UPI003784D1D0